jgi:hypothetical protein
MRATGFIRAAVPAALIAGWLIAAPVTSAHEHVKVGQYELGIGWAVEPTYVGVLNAVEISVEGPDGEPVADLPDLALRVTVSTADQSTEALELVQAFDTPGQYLATLLPTAPGEYTFHIVGDIHEQAVDVTMTSGDTFSSVQAPTDVEFPFKVPTQADVAEHLDRVDGRIEDLQGSAINPEALTDLQESVAQVGNEADRASTTGLLVGGAGLVVAVIALFVAWRATRKGAGPA